MVELLRLLEIDTRPAGPDERRGHCPNPKHAKKPGPGSWQVRTLGDKCGSHVCYSCGFGGGPVSLIAAAKGISTAEAAEWFRSWVGFELLGEVSPSWSRKIEEEPPELAYPAGTWPLWRTVPPEVSGALDYVLARGLDLEEIKRWAIGATEPRGPEYPGRVILPIVVGGRMVDFVARAWVDRGPRSPKVLSGRRRSGALKEFSLWGYDDLDDALDVVHVCEGVWGAIALLHAGVRNVVASCGSAWSNERTELLRPWSKIVLIPDGDAAGASMRSKAASLRYDHDVFWADVGAGRQPDHLSRDEIDRLISSACRIVSNEADRRSERAELGDWTRKL